MKKRIISLLFAIILTLQFGFAAFADTETPIVPTDSGVDINGISLVLSGEIGLTFHVKVPRKYRSGIIKLEFMDEEPIIWNIADCPQDNNLRYTATYYLSAIELSEKVMITVYDAESNPLAQEEYSAEEYVNQLLKDEKATEAEKNIGKTLINYGHYAQLACSEANGWEIGKDYAEISAYSTPEAKTSVFSGYGMEWISRSEKFKKLAMSLRLDYKTSIMLYIPANEKPAVKVNGEKVEAELSERMENAYRIEISGINAMNLAKEFTVEIGDAKVKLCAFSYCNMAVNSNADDATVDAIRALYEFYEAIDNYRAW